MKRTSLIIAWCLILMACLVGVFAVNRAQSFDAARVYYDETRTVSLEVNDTDVHIVQLFRESGGFRYLMPHQLVTMPGLNRVRYSALDINYKWDQFDKYYIVYYDINYNFVKQDGPYFAAFRSARNLPLIMKGD